MTDPLQEAMDRKVAELRSRPLSVPLRGVEQIDPADYNDDTPGTFIVCEICRTPLNKLTTFQDNSEEWLHAQNWREYDHDPVPVVTKRKDIETQCDFCGVTGPLAWAFTGDRVTIPDMSGTIRDYGKVWSACSPCTDLIVAGDIDKLTERVLRVAPSGLPTSRLDRETRAMAYQYLWSKFLPTVYARSYIGPRIEPARLTVKMMPKLRNGLLKFWGEPAEVIRASRDVGGGGILAIPGVHAGQEDAFIVRYQPNEPVPATVWANHTQHLRAGIGVAELYWIAEKFTTLAVAAGKDFTEPPVLQIDKLPSRFGFMMFEAPIGEIQRVGGTAYIRGLTWTPVPGGVWFNLYVQGEDGDPAADVLEMRDRMGYLICPNAGSGMIDGAPVPQLDDPRFQFMNTLMATFFLMQQPGVAEESRAPIDKKYARSYQRAHQQPLPPVRIVDLRRSGGHHTGGGHAGRPMRFRQFRRGHWKQQAYGPKRGLRRSIYVSPYITGTEEMPFRPAQETVKVLR